MQDPNIPVQYQGQDVIDTDIPTELEAKLFCTTLGKFFWVCLQPAFYALRPLFTNPKKPINLEYVNTAIQISFDLFVVYFFGELVTTVHKNKKGANDTLDAQRDKALTNKTSFLRTFEKAHAVNPLIATEPKGV